MENPSTDDLRGELAALEAKAAQLSAMCNQLHNRIDLGFATATTRDREREVSDERKELFVQIDALKEDLRLRESAA